LRRKTLHKTSLLSLLRPPKQAYERKVLAAVAAEINCSRQNAYVSGYDFSHTDRAFYMSALATGIDCGVPRFFTRWG
jgi:hypothetical protein